MRSLLTCRELIDFLIDYVDGALTAEEQAAFDRHLSVCPACVDYVAEYRATMQAGRAAYLDRDEPVPEDVPEELVVAVLAARPKG